MILNQPQSELCCSVCSQLFLHARIVHPCGHIFCNMCIYLLLQHPGSEPKCPMCRHPIDKRNIVSAHDVDKAAKESYPEKYAKRMGEYRQWVKNREVVFEVGNMAEMRREEDEEGTWRRWWDWEFYINEINGEEGRYIQRVEVDLRPFFGNNPVLTRPPFRVSRVGWGTFNIKFTVHWRQIFDNAVQSFDYMLSFEGHKRNIITKFFKVDLPGFDQ